MTMRHRGFIALLLGCIVTFLIWPRHHSRSHASLPTDLGVGVSLTASEVIVSLRTKDGIFEEVARTQGTSEYVEMMQHMSAHSALHASPPYDTMDELWEDYPRQLKRKLRKSVGLSASTEVTKLSRMLEQALSASVVPGGGSLMSHAMVISYPALHGLCQEDIVDAAACLGIRLLSGQHRHQPRSLVAAYAGHGLGLCLNHESEELCRKEGLGLPVRQVLLVDYTEHALLLHASVMRDAYDLASHDITIFSDFSLGSKDTKGHDGAVQIGNAVRSFTEKTYSEKDPPLHITVIMAGNGVTTIVTRAVKEALERIGTDVEMLDSYSETIAARGAAELAWRSSGRSPPDEL